MLLAIARVTGETAPLLFTALNNQFFSTDLGAPMANLPVVIFQFATSPYDDWQKLAWGGALLITVTILALNIVARWLAGARIGPQVKEVAMDMPNTPTHATSRAASATAADGKTTQQPIKVEVKDVRFYYANGFEALKGINLELRDKTVTAFIGPSGCGKSTLLRILNRIYDLYPGQRATGEVLLDGRNILGKNEDLNLLRSKVGMVFQKPTPFPMSIYDNIAFGIRLYEKVPQVRDGRPRRSGAAQGGAVGRGQGQAAPVGPRPLRRPAAAPLHRPRRRGKARRCCCSTSRPRRSTRSRPPRSKS